MAVRVAFALSLGLLSAPASGQQEIGGILKRLQSVPATSTKADCDAELAKSTSSNAFDLFYGAKVCAVAKQKPESSFLLLAGQIRATPDMLAMMPAAQPDAKTAISLYGFIYSYAGGMGDEGVLRDARSRERLFALLDGWKPIYDAAYNPGWKTSRRASEAEYNRMLADSASGRRHQIERIVRLFSDDAYYALHREERDLYAKQGGPVEVGTPVSRRLSELARKMNERAVALGVDDMRMPDTESTNADPADDRRSWPPDAPGKNERVIAGVDDPVVKKCSDSAEFSSVAENSRILRVIVTTTEEWGKVWRADLEGGDLGPTRQVCTSNYSSSRPMDGPENRLDPLPDPTSPVKR